MDWLKQLVTLAMVIAMCLGATYIGSTQGASNSFREQLREAQGTVRAFDGGLLLVDFDKPLVSLCGDTQIYAYATVPSGLVLQLKPVFIPEDKAQVFNDQQGNVVVFPVWDLAPFFNVPGKYNIEFYVDNTCGYLPTATVKLKVVTFEMESRGVRV